MAKHRCLNEGSCSGNLDECNLRFLIEVRGGLEPGDKIFVCDTCMKVFFINKRPRCSVCSMPLSNPTHFYKGEQLFVDSEKFWPKHKFRPSQQLLQGLFFCNKKPAKRGNFVLKI